MPKVENVSVQVMELTKWGFKDQSGYVSLGKKLSEKDKSALVPGFNFEGEYYVADSGTRYLNKIVSVLGSKTTKEPKVTETVTTPDVERAKKFMPKFDKKGPVDNSMSKEEWAAKDQRISRQGAVQAAVIALAPVVSLENLPEEAVKLATSMLAFVNGGK